MKWLVLLKEYTIPPRRAREIAGKSLKIGFFGEAPMRAGAAWEKRGRAVRSQGPTFLFCELAQHGRNGGGPCAAKARPSSFASWRSMGETGEGRAQPRPDLPLLRAGAAWEKWGGPCAARPDLPFLRAGAARADLPP